jgi:hypothetical protein
MMLITTVLFLTVNLGSSLSTFELYLKDRNDFVQAEERLSINSAWKLTTEEIAVDNLLTDYKNVDLGLDPVPVQFNFKTMKPTIDNSKLFALLQNVPKGSLLHSHDVSSQDMQFYVDVSYWDGCLFNVADNSDYGSLTFLPTDGYVPIADVRNNWSVIFIDTHL